MNQFEVALNSILVEAFHNILSVEENFLKKNKRVNTTIREMHLLEYVREGKENGKTVSEIAQHLKIAKPSVTVMVNKLVKKGFLVKRGSEADGRVVHVILTRAGRVVETYHHMYHVNMVRELAKEFNEEEKDVLIRAIGRLNEYFKNSAGGTEE